MARTRAHPALRLLALAGVATLAGCAAEPVATQPVASLSVGQAPLDLVSPAVRGSENGLEVLWLVAHDEDNAVAQALAPYLAQPVPLAEDARARWADNGLRIVRLPVDDLATLEKTLRLIGIINRQWMGWALEWREAFRGRTIEPDAPLAIGGVRRAMPGGALRFVARCWTAPTEAGPVIRVELTPQLFERRETRSRAEELAAIAAGQAPVGFDALSEGRVFESLAIDAPLTPGYAYVIVGEAPGVDWGAPPKATEAPRIDDSGFMVEPRAAGPSAAFVAGPPALTPPTIGEAMLNVRALGPEDRPARALVILLPRTPARFDLFAP